MSNKSAFTASNLSSQKREVKTKRRSSKSGKRFLKVCLTIIWIIVIFFLSVWFISWFKWLFDNVKKVLVSSVSKTVWTPMKKDQYNSVNVLILWYGWATHQWWFLTDSIMVASRNPDENNVTLFSLPRDLYVKSPVTNGYGRINAIFPQYYSRTQSVEESALWFAWKVGEMLGLDIPYYATVDFQTFKEIVDSLWWVDVYVDKTINDPQYPADDMIHYNPFYIEAWEQHLDGNTALKYARSRHTTSDFDRAKRQQKLIIAIKDKMLEQWLSISTATQLYDQYKKYIQTNISAQEMLRTVQFLPEIKEFSSFGYTSTCGDRDVTRMVPWCFLYNPPMAQFGGMSVLLPDGASAGNVSNYEEMKTFVTFLLTHRKFLTEWASVEVVNAVDSSVLNSNWLWRAWIATKLWVKMVKYWLNVTNVANAEAPVENSYITINMVWDFSGTIEAIQTFFPIQDIRVDTWSVQVEYDEEWNVKEYRTNRAYVTVTLWNDFVLWNENFPWLAQQKFSYKLDIAPIPPLPKEESEEVSPEVENQEVE